MTNNMEWSMSLKGVLSHSVSKSWRHAMPPRGKTWVQGELQPHRVRGGRSEADHNQDFYYAEEGKGEEDLANLSKFGVLEFEQF